MTQNSKRIAVILSVLILVIGFAAVTTTLVLNGGLLVGEADDFKIIFTEAILDGRKDNSLISSDKKTITFESKELLDLNDKTTLEYMVANTSRNYDANVSVNCSISSNTSEYVYVRNNPSEMIVEAGTSKKGTIEVELIKVLTESKEVSLTCELVSTPIERDNLANEYTEPEKEPFSEAGTIKSISARYYSGFGDLIPERVDFWEYWDIITKITFEDNLSPHETSEDLIFDVSAESSSNVVMAYLVKNDVSMYDLYIQSETGVKANSDSSNLFIHFVSLKEIIGLEHFDTSGVLNMNSMFRGCWELTNLDLSNFDTKNVTDMNKMFASCFGLTDLDLSNFDTSNVTDMREMFYPCNSLTNLDISNFDTKNVTDMRSMFSYCSSLTSLDVSNFDTKNVTGMSSMFSSCSSLISLDVSNFNTSSVTDMGGMFYDCRSLTSLDVSNFDTSSVTDMGLMFSNCSSLTSLDVSNFDTKNVTGMSSMFSSCSSLISLDVSNFNTSKVIGMGGMFYDCRSLTNLNLSNFNTSKVFNMSGMFSGCSNLTSLDLSNFDTSNVTTDVNMFSAMPDNAKVYVKDIASQEWILNLESSDRPSAWTTENVVVKV